MNTGLAKTGQAGPLATAMMCILNCSLILKPVQCASQLTSPSFLSSCCMTCSEESGMEVEHDLTEGLTQQAWTLSDR